MMTQKQLIDYAKSCVLFGVLVIISPFDPSKINELKPCSSDIDNLCVLPFMDSDDIIE